MGDSMTRQYDGVRPVVEGTLSGDTWTTTAVNYWEGPTYYSPLASRYLPSGGGAYNYLADGLGSTRQLMRNTTHAITDTYMYDAFGNTLTSTGTTDNPYRYVGGLGYRAGGGYLAQLGDRYYAAETGVLMQADPRLRGTRPSTATLLGVHAYAYCGQNPVLRADPTGQIWWLPCLCALLAAIGISGCGRKPPPPPYYADAWKEKDPTQCMEKCDQLIHGHFGDERPPQRAIDTGKCYKGCK